MRLIERRIGLLFAGFLSASSSSSAAPSGCRGCRARSSPPRRSSQQTESVTVPGLRGSVLDRHGNALAASEDAATIFATPYQVKNPPQAAEKLAPILGVDKGEVLESLTAESGFSYVAHKVDLPTAARIERLEPGRDRRAARQPPHLPAGRHGRPGDRRRRLRKPGPDRARGGRGIGAARHRRRTAHRQRRARRTDPAGNRAAKPSDGEDIQLTLDPAIQAKTEEVLAEVGETYAPKGATAIVMDPRNSQILAMANWPPVDPDDLSSASTEDLMNRATGFTYEPGSTFKAFTVSAALEEKQVTPDTDLHPAAADPGRRPDDRRRRGARHRDAERRRRSSPSPRTSAR